MVSPVIEPKRMKLKTAVSLGAVVGFFFCVAVLLLVEVYGVWSIHHLTPNLDIRVLLWPASEWLTGDSLSSSFGIARTAVLVAINCGMYAAFAGFCNWLIRSSRHSSKDQ
jgi:hypothetical protein